MRPGKNNSLCMWHRTSCLTAMNSHRAFAVLAFLLTAARISCGVSPGFRTEITTKGLDESKCNPASKALPAVVFSFRFEQEELPDAHIWPLVMNQVCGICAENVGRLNSTRDRRCVTKTVTASRGSGDPTHTILHCYQ